MQLQNYSQLKNWIQSIENNSDFYIKDIPFSQTTGWGLNGGKIQHKSGRFFNVVGLRFQDELGETRCQPFIEQREIGTLGYILKVKDKPELLLHAKIEPGNVGVVQIAPSCQATESNSAQVHGGQVPPLSDYFLGSDLKIITNTIQSEQGTRFLGKFNKNVLVEVDNFFQVDSQIHRWFPVDEALNLLSQDYLFNTDSRSVLVCSDWSRLVNREPFTKFEDSFSKDLNASFLSDGNFISTDELKKQVLIKRLEHHEPEIIDLHNMPNYRLTDFFIEPKGDGPLRVKYISTTSKYREVENWQQPIIDSLGNGKVCLPIGRNNGILHFLFKSSYEPGLINKVELHPALTTEPGEKQEKNIIPSNVEKNVILETWQSDEGGRFFFDKSLYQLIDVGPTFNVPESYYWLSLKQIRKLIEQGSWLTNESRSVISLLLKWL